MTIALILLLEIVALYVVASAVENRNWLLRGGQTLTNTSREPNGWPIFEPRRTRDGTTVFTRVR